MIQRIVPLLMLALLAVVVLSGCGQSDVAAFREASAALGDGASLPDDLFAAEITFCRRLGSKTGKRIGTGSRFRIKDGKKFRYVMAMVDLRNVPAGRDHQVHLSWIRPDGREMFRRFGTVRVTAADTGFTADVAWLDAEDLHKVKAEDPVTGDRPDVTLSSRFRVSPDREREPGDYLVRLYWNRELMLEEGFELLAYEGGDD